MSVVEKATFEADGEAIFTLVNECYEVETGDSGMCVWSDTVPCTCILYIRYKHDKSPYSVANHHHRCLTPFPSPPHTHTTPGVAFKLFPRMQDASQADFLPQYRAGQVLKITSLDTGRLEGVIFYEEEVSVH